MILPQIKPTLRTGQELSLRGEWKIPLYTLIYLIKTELQIFFVFFEFLKNWIESYTLSRRCGERASRLGIAYFFSQLIELYKS